jgi:hypothetical protein
MSAKLLINPIQIQNRLHERFGVTREALIEVVEQGVLGRNECTGHHPASMPGTRCWGDATRALRDLLVPLGWTADNTDNIPSVVSKKLKIKLAVTNANSGTGIEWGHPQPIREKGDGAQRAVFPNQTVLAPILDGGLNDTDSNGTFWYLCIYCRADMIRAELLCPILDADGSFRDFHERIALISDQDGDGGFVPRREIPEVPAGDSGLEISVTRKKAAL